MIGDSLSLYTCRLNMIICLYPLFSNCEFVTPSADKIGAGGVIDTCQSRLGNERANLKIR